MFDTYLEELHKRIGEHGGELIDLPADFRTYQSSDRDSKIQSWLWKVKGFRRWRVTRLDAGKTLQVLNSVAYPVFTKDMPIMGIDLLWFGLKKKLVAVLDFQPLIQEQSYFDKYFDGLKSLKDSFPDFNYSGQMFSYNPNQYFSPWVLFCKGGLQEAEKSLPVVFNAFLDCYLELHKNNNSNSIILDKEQVMKLQINYDKYSSEKDPAHGLFTSFFGKEWSDRFLNEFLFPFS